MGESQSIKKMRQTLYEEIWAEPMTTVAVKYGISDNGLRKRCKSLNIPWPPNGYWAKVKAGKPVLDRPPLPPYDEATLSYEYLGDESSASKVQPKKKKGILELLDLEDLSVEQLENTHDFDLLAHGSLEIFTNWCNGLTVPGRIQDYDELISQHKSEMEYREERDKEYPFRADGIKVWKGYEELREEQHKREQKRQEHRNALINDISAHADRWFKHEHLSKYADELEASLATYEDKETARLLKEYIRLVRENADKSNPINYILREMRIIESQKDN